ncbi:hypothetical protein [Streptomyces sp. NPDC048659]|uniref:hypothetical protein n=1 Tax=Streptomyces sp. NPDC048659 TaxID=3155489 RepID=UPI003436BA1F
MKAIDHPTTRQALDRYRGRALCWAGGGLVTMLLGVFLGGIQPGVGVLGSMLGFAAWGLGLFALRNYWRIRQVLRTGPWLACTAVTAPSVWSGPSVVLRHPATGTVMVRSVVAVRQRWHLAEPDARGVLWWCGDVTRGGVLVRPDGDGLLWARTVGSAREKRTAIRSGLLTGAGTGAQARVDVSRPAGGAGGQALVRAVRWRLLAGLMAAGLMLASGGVAAVTSTGSDPYVPLIVESGPTSDGTCVVSWSERDTYTEHFVDLPCREGLIGEPSAYGFRFMDGWMIAHGPFQGDLYNADMEGTGAFTAYGVGVLVGGLVFLGSGGTLAVRWAAAARRRTASGVEALEGPGDDEPRVSLLKTPVEQRQFGWAELSAAASEQARSRPDVPNGRAPATPDTAGAPWWRIGPLLELAGVKHLGGTALIFLGAVAVFIVTGRGSWIILAVTCGAFLAACARTLRAARTARELARDAAHEPQQLCRYVLLREATTQTPWALYFATADASGDTDTPFAAQPLLANQPLPGPSGEAKLHGTADQLDIRVPRIEGRSVWPAGDYVLLGTDPTEDRAFFEALALR